MQNRGKQFEQSIQKAFDIIENCYVFRLHDDMSGFKNINNPCDFIVYQKPHIYLIECKSCYGASLPLSNISNNQRESLCKASITDGVIAGYLIWFIDKYRTIFMKATELEEYIKQSGRKSIPFDVDNAIEIKGKKKRVFFDYDMREFLNEYK